MLIKKDTQKKVGRRSRSHSGQVYLKYLLTGVVSVALAAAVFIVGFFSYSKIYNYVHDKGFHYFTDSTDIFSYVDSLSTSYIRKMKLPVLRVDIKFKDYKKLEKQREKALAIGRILKKELTEVPVQFRFYGNVMRGKVRLKGDLPDHLKGKKWSFRVKMKGEGNIFGLKSFNIQNPATRGFQSELLFMDFARKYGILAPRYYFIREIINGNDIGVMLIEEHFRKELLESQGRREGVILKFDESLAWNSEDGEFHGFKGVFDNYKNLSIVPFGAKNVNKSKILRGNLKSAIGMLRGFIEGKIKASYVFDKEMVGKFLAAAELWGSWHGVRWNNIRFYFNPVTYKIEPVVFDMDIPWHVKEDRLVSVREPIFKKMFEDPLIYQCYLKWLKTFVGEVKNGDVIEWLKNREKEYLRAIRTEFYFLDGFPFDYLRKRAVFLKNITENFSITLDKLVARSNWEGKYATCAHAYIINGENEGYLELAGTLREPVLVTGIRIEPRKKKGKLPINKFFGNLKFPIRLEPIDEDKGPVYKKIPIVREIDLNVYKVVVTSKIEGGLWETEREAMPYFEGVTKPIISMEGALSEIGKEKFLVVDKKERTITFKKGNWEVSKILSVPEGYTLKAVGGTTLSFSRNTGIVSYGPLVFIGDEKGKVILKARNRDSGWMGLIVLSSRQKSILDNVLIMDTKGIRIDGWETTGAVTFYETSVIAKNLSIVNNRCEDALNLINSDVQLSNLDISGTTSDAVDFDFSTGVIEDSKFENIGVSSGGDAIDASGSSIIIKNVKFKNISDKAISAGEKSTVSVENVKIADVTAGVVSKDASSVSVNGAEIDKAKVAGLMTYVKKSVYSMFEKPSLEASRVTITNTSVPAIAQNGTRLLLNGEKISMTDLDVNALYNKEMKKQK